MTKKEFVKSILTSGAVIGLCWAALEVLKAYAMCH